MSIQSTTLSNLSAWLNRWWLALVIAVMALWGVSASHSSCTSAPQVHWISHTLTAMPPDGAPVHIPVTLPQSWKKQGWVRHGKGTYVSVFSIDHTGVEDSDRHPWSLRIDRLSYVHQIWLNGHLLRSTLPRPNGFGDPVPTMIDIPGGLLRRGLNELTIQIQSTMLGGMSAPIIAPKADLQSEFMRLQVLTETVPLVLNLICITFSLFLVTLWWQRRQESAAGLFGLIYLVACIRNSCYYITVDLGLPNELSTWLYFCAHVVSGCIACWFCMVYVAQRQRWYNRLVWTVLIGFPLIGLVNLLWDPLLEHTRSWMQAGLMLLLPGLFMLWQRAPSTPRTSTVLHWHLTLGMLCMFATTIHDYAMVRTIADVNANIWLPWAFPLALPSFSMVLLSRVVRAFNDIEETNVDLELKVANRTHELASANAAKSRFLAAASHDLRQPVAAIGLINDLLRDKLPDPASRDLSDRLTHAVVSMESLLKGLLDLSRLDSGVVDVHPQRVDLRNLMSSIASHEDESARHKGLALRVRVPHHIEAMAWTDPVLLEQILRNLVGNAVRHTHTGGVLVSVRQRKAHLLIQVWDTGLGIAPSDQARVFEEFVQLNNPARDRRQGLGLGLTIVQRAAHKLGHTIALTSHLGRGTCFSLTLPCAPTLMPALPTTEPSPIVVPGTMTQWPTPVWRVMLVEDELPIQEALVKLLTNWGMLVHAGQNLAWARQQTALCDLVITDHRLPDGTGRQVVEHVRSLRPGLPALIISGDTSPEQLAVFTQSKLPVLYKPFSAEKLRAMIESIMALRMRDDSSTSLLQSVTSLGSSSHRPNG